nr:MAG: Replication initiator protein A (RepA) N-terminus [Bacteriophage sp.]
MSVVKDNNFIAIQGWMRTKLNLKGNELLIYALIYGFSQDGESRFKGSRKYIADWCGCSLNTVDRSLSSLVDKGLLAKYPHIDDNGSRLVDYVAIYPTSAAMPAPATTQSTAQDPWGNTTNATTEQFQTSTYEPQPLPAEPEPKPQPKKTRKTKSFDDIIDAYTNDPQTKDLLGAWLQNRKAKRNAMTDRAIQSNIKKLDQYAQASHMSVNDYLDEVICRGWGSFFIIENYRNNGYQQKPRQQSQQPHWDLTEEELRKQKEADDEWLKNCVF